MVSMNATIASAEDLAKRGQYSEALEALSPFGEQSLAARALAKQIQQQAQGKNSLLAIGILNAFFLEEGKTEIPAPLENLRSAVQSGLGLEAAYRSLDGAQQSEIQQKVGESRLREIFSISQNLDAKGFWQETIHLGVRLKGELDLAKAAGVLNFAQQDYVPADLRETAQAEFKAIVGQGSSALRSEVVLAGLGHEMTNYKTVLPMVGAAFLGQVAGTAALGRLGGASRSAWYSSGLTARLLAGTASYLVEVPIFGLGSRYLNGTTQTSVGEDLSRAAVSLGVLRAVGFLGNQTFLNLHGFNELGVPTRLPALARFNQLALPQAFLFGGLLLSQGLEQKLQLRGKVQDETTVTDTLGSMVAMLVGSHLGHAMLGADFAAFQREMGVRTDIFTKLGDGPPREAQEVNAPAFVRAQVAGGSPFLGPVVMMMSNGGNGGGDRPGQNSMDPSYTRFPDSSERVTVDRPLALAQRPEQVSPTPPGVEGQFKDHLIGQVINNHVVEELIGVGGFGAVYRCRHQVLKKFAALKVLKQNLTSNKEVTSRFVTEAQSAASIGNPHIIDISNFGHLEDGSTYIMMEFLQGQTMDKLMNGFKPVPEPRLLQIAYQIADGLDSAHTSEMQIVHRDLKPENIFLVNRGGKDFVKILDFGIAKVKDVGQTKLTQDGTVFGTPLYMSPEQSAGSEDIDFRSDIYSLGVMLYEMATGKVPFSSNNSVAIATMHIYTEPKPISELVPLPQKIQPGLEALILQCLSKNPAQRPESMKKIKEEIQKLMVGQEPEAVFEMKSRSWKGRMPMIVGISGFGIAAILGAAFLISRQPQTQAAPVPPPSTLPPPQPEVGPPASIAAIPSSVPSTREVQLSVDPPDAHIFLKLQPKGEKDLGSLFVKIPVESGSPVQIEVRRKGYRPQKFKLDGSEGDKLVTLESITAKGPPSSPPSQTSVVPPKPKPTNSNGKPINPWE